jgi:hypothetical protein
VSDEVVTAMFYDPEGNEMPDKKLSFPFFLSMFTSPRLNPNHRGGSGTTPRRLALEKHTENARIYRKLAAKQK